MTGILLILVLAVTVEAIVEYVKTIMATFSGGDRKTAALQVLAVIISILICFAASADLYAALGIVFAYHWVGIVLTGIFASRGANYVSDFIGNINKYKSTL